jgi:hypothetical protein
MACFFFFFNLFNDVLSNTFIANPRYNGLIGGQDICYRRCPLQTSEGVFTEVYQRIHTNTGNKHGNTMRLHIVFFNWGYFLFK